MNVRHLVLLSAVCAIVAGARAGDANRSAAATKTPALLLLDADHLAAVRARVLGGEARLRAAVDALKQEAAEALAMQPVSVMDKSIVPPSGDKHDYMSQAPYWWPDPGKPDGRPYIRRDGERNPEINRISDHANLGRVIGSVSTLGLAYFFTADERYAAHGARLVRTWFLDPATRMNPHLKFGQAIPGITEGRGIGIIETRGLGDLLDGVLLLSGSPSWSAEDDAGLRQWMREYVAWLVGSPHGRDEASNGNNHETWYDVQVSALALYTDQRDLARRTLEGSRARIARQIEPDGRQPRELARTRSFDYSVMNLSGFFALATLGERAGVDLWTYRTSDGRSIRHALDFLVPFAGGERQWTYTQITPFRPQSVHALLRRAASAWREPRYRALAERLGGSTPRLTLTLRP